MYIWYALVNSREWVGVCVSAIDCCRHRFTGIAMFHMCPKGVMCKGTKKYIIAILWKENFLLNFINSSVHSSHSIHQIKLISAIIYSHSVRPSLSSFIFPLLALRLYVKTIAIQLFSYLLFLICFCCNRLPTNYKHFRNEHWANSQNINQSI